MEVAEKHNLSVIMALFAPQFDNTSGAFTPPLSPSMLDSTSPNLWGFQLTDEPAGSAMFSLLARFRKAIEAARPAQPTLSFANLLPNYGMDAEWGPGAQHVLAHHDCARGHGAAVASRWHQHDRTRIVPFYADAAYV